MGLFDVALTASTPLSNPDPPSDPSGSLASPDSPSSRVSGDRFETAPQDTIFSSEATLLADASPARTSQQFRGDLQWATFEYQGEQHRFLMLGSTGRYSQTYSGAEDEDYNWGINPLGSHGKMYRVGCTITALGNALGVTGQPSPSPTQTNHRTPAFWRAFNEAYFEDLSGQGRAVYKRYGLPPKIEQMNPVDIYNADHSGYTPETESILQRAGQAVREGKAVLIGFRGNGRGWRHSVVIDAVGDRLWASDPFTEDTTAERIPLTDLMKQQGHRQIDYAYAVSGGRVNPENSLSPEFYGP